MPDPDFGSSRLIFIGWISSCNIFMAVILIVLLTKLYYRKENKTKLSALQKTVHSVALLSAFSCGVCDLIHVLYGYGYNEPLSSTRFRRIEWIGDTLYFIESLSIYIIIVGRIYQPFKSTKYELSMKFVIFYIFLMVIQAILMALFIYSLQMELIYLQITIIALMINEFIINITVLILFISKIQSIIIDRGVLEYEEFKNTELTNKQQQTYITIITKHTILSCFMMLFNPSFYIFGLFSDEYWLDYCFRGLENCVVVTCLFLLFQFNYGTYYCICKCCHIKLYIGCTAWSRRNIEKKIITAAGVNSVQTSTTYQTL